MRVLKLHLSSQQLATISAARELAPEPPMGNYTAACLYDHVGNHWLAEQLTDACQRRIDEVKSAAKGAKL
jgi:hypothetical protein